MPFYKKQIMGVSVMPAIESHHCGVKMLRAIKHLWIMVSGWKGIHNQDFLVYEVQIVAYLYLIKIPFLYWRLLQWDFSFMLCSSLNAIPSWYRTIHMDPRQVLDVKHLLGYYIWFRSDKIIRSDKYHFYPWECWKAAVNWESAGFYHHIVLHYSER